MHPRIHSHRDSRAISPTPTLGVAVGSPRFAGTAARTAHSPGADAQRAEDAVTTDDPEPGDLAPFASAPSSPTDGERVEPVDPVGVPQDQGLSVEGPAGSIAAAASTRDVEGGGGNADMVDVIPVADGAAPADAATWGRDAE